MEPTSLPALLIRAAAQWPDQPAQIFNRDGHWHVSSYRELLDRVQHIAAGLAHRGVRRGDRVGLVSRTRAEWLALDYAIMSLGAVTVPVFPSLPAREVQYILKDAGATMAAVEDPDQWAKLPPDIPGILITGSVPGVPTLDEVVEDGPRQPLREWEDHVAQIGRDDLATIVYTSGTTGQPKGVMLTHGNILSNVEALQVVGRDYPGMQVGRKDVALAFLPLSHILERSAEAYFLSQGCTIGYARSVDTLAEDLKEVRPTVLVAVPRVFEKVYARVLDQLKTASGLKRGIFWWAIGVGRERYRHHLARIPVGWNLGVRLWLADRLVYAALRRALGGRIRFVISGGAALAREIGEFFYAAGIPIFEGYGLTETAPVLTANTPRTLRYGTVGRPLPGVDIRIAEDGEILARGPNVMKGYWNRPEETAAALAGGWFHTGDIGHFDPDGNLVITDRKKSLLVLSTGKNVAPAPIEQLLVSSPFIEQAVVIGDRRNYVSALLYLAPGRVMEWARQRRLDSQPYRDILMAPDFQSMLMGEIRRLIRDLPDFEQPKRFAFLPRELTEEIGALSPSLKVKRKVVEQIYRDLIDQLYAGDQTFVVPASLAGAGTPGGSAELAADARTTASAAASTPSG